MNKSVIIVKLGGSIITDKTKPYTPNIMALKRLSSDIKKAGVPVVIIHGQGSFAHTSAAKYGGKKGYKSTLGVAKVFNDAMKMNSIVMDALIDAKIPAVSFRPNSLFLSKKGQVMKNNLEPVVEAINQGIVPVMYGDVIMDTEWKSTIFSGETSSYYLVLFLLMKKIEIAKIIQVGVTDGVYTDKKTIPKITVNSYKEIKKHLLAPLTTDVTGGMQHKVEEALKLAKLGIPTQIINGTRKNELFKALSGVKLQLQTTIR